MKLKLSKKLPFRGMLAIAVVSLSASMAASTAIAAVGSEAVVRAIQQRVCFEDFWWNRDSFQLGKTVPIILRKDDGIAYVWGEGLAVVPGASRWANFFTVVTKGNQTVVGSSYGYNLDNMRGTPDFEKNKSRVFGGEVETAQLRIPVDCTPHFTKETSQKERVLRTIEMTMTNELTLFNKSGGTHYPDQLRIVIANFNLDYPETQVFVPSTKEVFHVALQDAADPLSDAFLKQGEYPVRPEYNQQAVKVLRSKIAKYGIVREITLGGG